MQSAISSYTTMQSN